MVFLSKALKLLMYFAFCVMLTTCERQNSAHEVSVSFWDDCEGGESLLLSKPLEILSRKELEAQLGVSVTTADRDPLSTARLQKTALHYLVYEGNPLPPEPTQSEVLLALNKLATTSPVERTLMYELFRCNPAHVALAQRDTDGDGRLDFFVDEYSGKLHFNDLDIDGDGILNIWDEHPYDPQRGGRDTNGDGRPDRDFIDKNGNGIPDMVDLALLGSEQIGEVQKRIADKLGILILQRDLPWSEKDIELLEISLDLMAASLQHKQKQPYESLQGITLERYTLLYYDASNETFGFFNGQTKIAVFQPKMQQSPALLQMSVMVHEIAHAVQYSYDDTHQEGALHSEFMQDMISLGWEETFTPRPDKVSFKHVELYWESQPSRVENYQEAQHSYKGKTISEWAEFLEEVYKEHEDESQKDSMYFSDKRLQKYHLVTDYALTSPLEFHSEGVTAALWLALRQRMRDKKTDEDPTPLFRKIVADNQDGYGFYEADYFNAEGSDYIQWFNNMLRFQNKDLDRALSKIFSE